MIFGKESKGSALRQKKDSFDAVPQVHRDRGISLPVETGTVKESFFAAGANRSANDPGLPGGPNIHDVRRIFRRPGKWHMPGEKPPEEGPGSEKHQKWNLQGITVSAINLTLNSETLLQSGILSKVSSLVPFATAFFAGFALSRADSVVEVPRAGDAIMGVASVGISLFLLTEVIAKACTTSGLSVLVDLGLFSVGFLAGKISKKWI